MTNAGVNIDYKSIADDVDSWHNNENFFKVRTPNQLIQILDLCKLPTKYFVDIFDNIHKLNSEYSNDDENEILKHSSIKEPENFDLCFEVLKRISNIIKIHPLTVTVDTISKQKAKFISDIENNLKKHLEHKYKQQIIDLKKQIENLMHQNLNLKREISDQNEKNSSEIHELLQRLEQYQNQIQDLEHQNNEFQSIIIKKTTEIKEIQHNFRRKDKMMKDQLLKFEENIKQFEDKMKKEKEDLISQHNKEIEEIKSKNMETTKKMLTKYKAKLEKDFEEKTKANNLNILKSFEKLTETIIKNHNEEIEQMRAELQQKIDIKAQKHTKENEEIQNLKKLIEGKNSSSNKPRRLRRSHRSRPVSGAQSLIEGELPPENSSVIMESQSILTTEGNSMIELPFEHLDPIPPSPAGKVRRKVRSPKQ
ncbi:hypothetical protein TVAG_269130 [Trichomonas vaginalis G3]|uniref:Uncharacterized protein n=1 Tax=Trichomonas vaginalis (strain ATCC PRA-98 / G3) TaxID=412133 RepID=A2EG26_TRIV3|nr:protein ubiquitination [Trichomonas vaginalis G3]EAY08387.1 hypothetical protein TVAG_269130 [Trichomonas vaginalis G3]KAI5499333.1 protein ubiquitination [Trichomonas vaginalis G3]|eukprot:XP_001320610.1 hypothetical protein [Trichomonas vaginalis G3]